MVPAVLDRIFAAVLVAVQGAPAADTGVLERSAPPALLYPAELSPGPFDPPLSARAYISVDLASGAVVFGRNTRERRPIASLTKIMTGLLSAERGNLTKRIRVPLAATRVEPTRDDLRAGRRYTRRHLLVSALLESANDSAYTLGYDLGDGDLRRFYVLMNDTAEALGMDDTRYASPSGLDDRRNRSTAHDQAIVSWYALGDPVFRKLVRTRTLTFPAPPPVYAREYRNHNRMLFSYDGTYGVKTGFTTAAGACLVVAVRRGSKDVLGVLLGSRDIWSDMPRLIDATLARAS